MRRALAGKLAGALAGLALSNGRCDSYPNTGAPPRLRIYDVLIP